MANIPDSKPATVEDIANVLETFGIRQGVDVNEWLRCVLPPTLSMPIRGIDVSPPRNSTAFKSATSDPVTERILNGVDVEDGQVEILRGLFFEEDSGSAADEIEVGLAGAGGFPDQEPLFLRQGGPFSNPMLIGDDSQFTGNIMAMLPWFIYPGHHIRIKLRRAVAGELGGKLVCIKETYTSPWRPAGA